MKKTAIIAVEARGQALSIREDATISLVQAGSIARTLARRGFHVAIRLIIDAAQSIEEYSLLGHGGEDVHGLLRSHIGPARDKREARYSLVREIRERRLPITISCDQPVLTPVEDRLFFAALLARITGINHEVMANLRKASHPLFNPGAVDAYEATLCRHVGRPYLDLEESIAREILGSCLGEAAAQVSIDAISRPSHDPASWLSEESLARVIDEDLAAKEAGQDGEHFQSRLIGLFTTVSDPDEERAYFNSPTCCRCEHRKVRLIARDRYGVLCLHASERMSFTQLREMIALQNAGRHGRPVALKYPYAARYIAGSLVSEALRNAQEGASKVIFVEGVEGEINAATGGLIDRELSARLWGTGVEYHRVVARRGVRELLPNLPGGLILIKDSFSHTVTDMLPAI
jgi:hypothetical protein